MTDSKHGFEREQDFSPMTLAELREALGLTCSLPALHYVLADMNLTFKKRRSGHPNKTERTSAKHDENGKNSKVDLSLTA